MEPETTPSFHERFVELFDSHFARIFRYLNRLSGERDLAKDVAQEAFVRLYRRGSMPDNPTSWLIAVAMNLFRNEATTRARRLRLLTAERGERVLGDPPSSPDHAAESADSRERVRAVLERLPERERQILLLRAEGYAYREIAAALGLNESSIGAFLARARRAFREIYERSFHAP